MVTLLWAVTDLPVGPVPAMSPLFRKSEEKRALEAEAQAEIDRLRKLSIDEVAILLMPAIEAYAAEGRASRQQDLCNYLVRDFPGAKGMKPLQLMARVRSALEELRRVDIVAPISITRTPVWRLTGAGERAIRKGSVAELLSGD